MTEPLTIHRLMPADAESWRLWPTLEARLRQECAPTGQTWETPADALIAHCRTLWYQSPTTLGAWLICQGDDVIGHVVAWVQGYWGEPFIAVYHVAMDSGHRLGAVRGELYAAVSRWIDELNDASARAGLPERIRCLRFLTDRPEAWRRYMGLTPRRVLTEVRVETSELLLLATDAAPDAPVLDAA